MAGKILGLKQVSERLGVSNRTILNLIRRGELHGFKVGEMWKVEEEEVMDYIKRQKQKAGLDSPGDPPAVSFLYAEQRK
jgi:excisionase family DNA binding protein